MRNLLLIFALCAIGCQGNHSDGTGASDSTERPFPSHNYGAILRDRNRSDTDLIITCRHALASSAPVNANALIEIVNDRSRTPTARGLAFILFWQKSVHPPVPLAQIVEHFDIRSWFSSDTVDDVSQAPTIALDGLRALHPFDYSYFQLTFGPDAPPVGASVVVAVSKKLSKEELIAMLHEPGEGNVTIQAVRVNFE